MHFFEAMGWQAIQPIKILKDGYLIHSEGHSETPVFWPFEQGENLPLLGDGRTTSLNGAPGCESGSMPKIWILDVDGVINPVGIKPRTDIWKDWIEHTVCDENTGRTFPVKIAVPVRNFLAEMSRRPDVQIVWHTTWQTSANAIADVFDFPRFPVLKCPEFESWNHRSAQGWWKTPAVERILAATFCDVLWTDDDLAVVSPLPHHPSGILKVVAPDQHTGLTPKHLKQIRAFLEGTD